MIIKSLLVVVLISLGASLTTSFTKAHISSKPASTWEPQIITPRDQMAQKGWSIAGSGFRQAGGELSSVGKFSQAGGTLQQAAAHLRQASLAILALGADAEALSAALGTIALSMEAAGQTIATGQFDKTVYQLELLKQALKDFRCWFEKDERLKAALELATANLKGAIGFMEGLAREGEMLKVVNDMIETARRMSQEDLAHQVEQILGITDPFIQYLMELNDPEVIKGLRMLLTPEASSWRDRVSRDPRAWLRGAMQEGFVLALNNLGRQFDFVGTTLLLTPIAFLLGFCCPDDCILLGSITSCRVSAVSVVLAGHTPGSEKTLQKVTPQQGKGIVQGWKAIWKNTQLVDIYVKCSWQKCENTGCFPCFWQTDTDWVDKESGWVQVKNPRTGPSWLPPSVWDRADTKNFQDLANATCTATCK